MEEHESTPPPPPPLPRQVPSSTAEGGAMPASSSTATKSSMMTTKTTTTNPPFDHNLFPNKTEDSNNSRGGGNDGSSSTGEDSLQLSETSLPDESDHRMVSSSLEEPNPTALSFRKTESFYDDNMISSLEPSPAAPCQRKTGSFHVDDRMMMTSSSLEPSPEVTVRKTESFGGVGGAVTYDHQTYSSGNIPASGENCDNGASCGRVPSSSTATTDSASSAVQPTDSVVKQHQHTRQSSLDTSIAASTLTSVMNNNNSNVLPKTTIEFSQADHHPSRTNQKLSSSPQMTTAPVKHVSVPNIQQPMAMSDVGSVGSVPSTLESVRCISQQQLVAAPLQPTHYQQLEVSPVVFASHPNSISAGLEGNNTTQQQQQNNDMTQSAVVIRENDVSSTGPSTGNTQVDGLSAFQPQQEQQQQQQSFLVAVPPQAQPGLYYQVPSVVSLPVESGGTVDSSGTIGAVDATPSHSRQTSSASLLTLSQQTFPVQAATVTAPAAVHPDQVIGMVGAIPVVKIQGSGLHYVKKKKGRFNLLQEAAPASDNDHSSVPNNITVPARSQSPMSTISQGASVPPSNPQTFDGKSAPTVKKKGRFVVTNVKNPGSIRNIQQDNGTSKASSPDTYVNGGVGVSSEVSSQGPAPPPLQPILDQNAFQDHAPQPGIIHHVTQPGIIHHTIPTATNMSIPVMIQPIASYGQQQQQYMSTTLQTSVPLDTSYDNVQYSLHSQYPMQDSMQQGISSIQQAIDGSVAVTFQPNIQPVIPLQQHPSTMMQQQQQQQQQSQLETISSSGYSQPQHYCNIQQSMVSPPQTPNVPSVSSTQSQVPTSGTNAELSPNHADHSVTQLPNVPIPKAPSIGVGSASTNTSNEKQRRQAPVPKMKTQNQLGRSAKLPQSMETGGLGKLCYFLDQMKKEVTDADRSIKTLQTDMKVLRDKNKELEAKNRDLEKKYREEKVLREKAEARIADLKHKLKDAKAESAAATTALMPKVSEDISLHEHEGTRKRADSFSVERPKAVVSRSSTVSLTQNDASNSSVASPLTTSTTALSTPTKTVPSTIGLSNGSNSNPGSASPSASTHSFSSEATKRAGASPQLSAGQGDTSMTNVQTSLNPQKLEQGDTALNEKVADAPSTQVENNSLTSSSMVTTPTPATYQPKISEAPASASSVPPLIPPLQQAGEGKPGHRHTHSLNDFDPFRSTATTNSTNLQQTQTTFPTVFFPAPMSLSTLPAYATPGTELAVAASEFDGTFMSPNPFVVPVSFGVASSHPDVNAGVPVTDDYHHHHQQQQPTYVSNGHTTFMSNGFTTSGTQQPQFVLVQQQSFGLNQQQQSYGQQSQQPQYAQNHVIASSSAPQMQQQQQPSSLPSQSNSQHDFDPMARR